MLFNLYNPVSRVVVRLACKLPVELVCIICTRDPKVVRVVAGEDFNYIACSFVLFASIGVMLAY